MKLSFKEQLKKEYLNNLKQKEQVTKLINQLTIDYYNELSKSFNIILNNQIKTFETNLKTSLNKNLFLEMIKSQLLSAARNGEISDIISTDNWGENLYKRLLGYTPSYTIKFNITKASISEFLKKSDYKKKFENLPSPTLRELIDTIYDNKQIMLEKSKFSEGQFVSEELKEKYLLKFKEKLCDILENFLSENDLTYDLETIDENDSDQNDWTNIYSINIIE